MSDSIDPTGADPTGADPRRPAEPRIVRAVPEGPVTRPENAIPVIARIRFIEGATMDVPAIARCWTRNAVEVTWEAPGLEYRTDWIPAADVRRSWTDPTAPGPEPGSDF